MAWQAELFKLLLQADKASQQTLYNETMLF